MFIEQKVNIWQNVVVWLIGITRLVFESQLEKQQLYNLTRIISLTQNFYFYKMRIMFITLNSYFIYLVRSTVRASTTLLIKEFLEGKPHVLYILVDNEYSKMSVNE